MAPTKTSNKTTSAVPTKNTTPADLCAPQCVPGTKGQERPSMTHVAKVKKTTKKRSGNHLPREERRRQMNAYIDELRMRRYLEWSIAKDRESKERKEREHISTKKVSFRRKNTFGHKRTLGDHNIARNNSKRSSAQPKIHDTTHTTPVHEVKDVKNRIHATRTMSPSTFTSLRGLATRLFAGRPSPSSLLTKPATAPSLQQTASYATKGKSGPPAGMFSGQKPGSKKKGGPKQADPRIINILRHFAVLSPKRIPPPLRFGRNRYLRHWTIHRGWLLFRRQQREQRERILMQQHQSISNACEELRNTEGPGTREVGYLYRVAMLKNGVYGLKSVPIEALVETPARQAWNHEWKP
ncbi:hypothetical protein QBC45DRAFT_450403 [Copromyces sp. CBS 386.78]|nr:hypothetical protein QBC45DRAFT_450403 [Copromyces sp. CBS 386.78]